MLFSVYINKNQMYELMRCRFVGGRTQCRSLWRTTPWTFSRRRDEGLLAQSEHCDYLPSEGRQYLLPPRSSLCQNRIEFGNSSNFSQSSEMSKRLQRIKENKSKVMHLFLRVGYISCDTLCTTRRILAVDSGIQSKRCAPGYRNLSALPWPSLPPTIDGAEAMLRWTKSSYRTGTPTEIPS